MSLFSDDPFKPLTEVERAFANAKLERLRLNEEDPPPTVERPARPRRVVSCRKWKQYADTVHISANAFVTVKLIAALMGRSLKTARLHCQTEDWERVRHPDERRALVFRLSDVMKTIGKFGEGRRRYRPRSHRPSVSDSTCIGETTARQRLASTSPVSSPVYGCEE